MSPFDKYVHLWLEANVAAREIPDQHPNTEPP